MTKFLGISNIALKIAVHVPCTVIIARDLQVGKGHLVCLDGSKKSLDALKKDAALANNCQCPISLIALADNSSTGVQRYFMGGVAFNVLEHAENSVMIIR